MKNLCSDVPSGPPYNFLTANERSLCHTCAAYINPSGPSDARNVIISSDDGLSPDHRQAIN